MKGVKDPGFNPRPVVNRHTDYPRKKGGPVVNHDHTRGALNFAKTSGPSRGPARLAAQSAIINLAKPFQAGNLAPAIASATWPPKYAASGYPGSPG
jgi:hypothetical protein